MRCTCCNAQFNPALIRDDDGTVRFEEMCSSCRGKVDPSAYNPNWEHEAISERPIQLYE